MTKKKGKKLLCNGETEYRDKPRWRLNDVAVMVAERFELSANEGVRTAAMILEKWQEEEQKM